MANSTIDLTLRTKADVSGVNDVKNAVNDANKHLISMGEKARQGAKDLKGVDNSGQDASRSLAVLSTSLMLVGSTLGGGFGRSLQTAATRLSQFRSFVDAARTLCPKFGTALGGVGKAFAAISSGTVAAVAGIAAVVSGLGVYLAKSREAESAAKALKRTYNEGYAGHSSVQSHAGYGRRQEKYAKEDAEAAKVAQEEEKAELERQKKIEQEKREVAWESVVYERKLAKARAANKRQEAIERLRLDEAEEQDEYRKLVARRKLVEAEAQERVTQAQNEVEGSKYDGLLAQEEAMGKLKKAQSDLNVARQESANLLREASERAREEYEARQKEIELAAKRAENERKAKEAAKQREDTTKQILALENQINAAREKAKQWDDAAGPARDSSFGDWARSGRDSEREKKNQEAKRQRRIAGARREYERLAKMNPKAITKGDREKLGKLREYLSFQDDRNNPFANDAQKLEEEKKKLQESMDKHLANIDSALGGNLQL